MLVLTAKIILIGGIAGMGFIILRKIPALSRIPEIEIRPSREEAILNPQVFGKKIKSFKSVLGQKIQKLKNLKKEKNFKEKKSHLSDDYWDKIRRG